MTENIPPGRRDYEWEIDTIYSGSFQTYMKSIWGTSYNNMWICGYDANNYTNIYHFDGAKWLPIIETPTAFIKNYSVISGIDSNYFILIGSADYLNSNPPPNFLDSGLVIIFDNGKWEVIDLNNCMGLYSLSILSKNNFWVGDRNSSLFHYNNKEWAKYSFQKDLLINGLVIINENNIYATAHTEGIESGDIRSIDYLLFFQGTEWIILDSNITSNIFNRNSFPALLKNINGQLFGSGDVGVVKKEGNQWIVIGEGLYGQINGTNENNIFLGHQDFGVMHYNGDNWHRFTELPPYKYYGIMVLIDSVFLLATDGNKSYVVRGKLSNRF